MVQILGKIKLSYKVLMQINSMFKGDGTGATSFNDIMIKSVSLPSLFINGYLLHFLANMKEKTSKLDSDFFA